MTRYKVVERRVYEAEFIIESDDEAAAGRREGEIVEENDPGGVDSWGESIVSVEEVGEEETL